MAISNCFSLWRPAISQSALDNLQIGEFNGSYRDDRAIVARTAIIAAAFFALAIYSALPVFSLPATILFGLSSVICVSTLWIPIELWRVDAAIDQKAVECFREKDVSQSLMVYAITHVKVVNKLIAEPALLNKCSRSTNTTILQATLEQLNAPTLVKSGWEKLVSEVGPLLHPAVYETFKALARVPGVITKARFIQLAQGQNFHKAACYLLNNGLVTSQGWTENEQFDLWISIKNYESALLLKQHGFNVESKKLGVTALQYIQYSEVSDRLEKIQALLPITEL
jgi:hypothetical protein